MVAARSAPGWLFRSRKAQLTIEGHPQCRRSWKHKDTQDTDTQTTQAQSTDGQGTEAQGTEDQSRGEQARPYLENASYPARRDDLAASVQQQGADQDVVDLIVLIPDDEYADVDAAIVQIELVSKRVSQSIALGPGHRCPDRGAPRLRPNVPG